MPDHDRTDNSPSNRPSDNFHRFDSMTALVEFCQRKFDTHDVVTANEGDELMVRINRPGAEPFIRLVAHFEGERTYVIGLPDDLSEPAP